MHHYKCIAPNADINLQSGRFWATSIASFTERFIDFRSCGEVFIHIVWLRPGGLLQFSKWEAVKICLTSDSSDIRAMWRPNTPCMNSSWKVWLLSFLKMIDPHISQRHMAAACNLLFLQYKAFSLPIITSSPPPMYWPSLPIHYTPDMHASDRRRWCLMSMGMIRLPVVSDYADSVELNKILHQLAEGWRTFS